MTTTMHEKNEELRGNNQPNKQTQREGGPNRRGCAGRWGAVVFRQSVDVVCISDSTQAQPTSNDNELSGGARCPHIFFYQFLSPPIVKVRNHRTRSSAHGSLDVSPW